MTGEISTPTFAIGQTVILNEKCAIYGMFPDMPGKVLERRYNVEHQHWLYNVEFIVGAYILPEEQLQEQKAGTSNA